MADARSTLRRRLLRLLPALGVRVTDLTSGVAVLSRRPGTRARALLPGAFLVETGRRAALDVTTVGEETFLVGRPDRRWRQAMKTERTVIQSLVPGVLMAHFDRYGVNCVLD